jgi:hypothetical protein
MIHYTLLPAQELRLLKKEYRTRVTIFMMFFLSFVILFGIFALMPAFIYSYSQEKVLLARLGELHKGKASSGIDEIRKDLSNSTEIINRLKNNKTPFVYSSVISQIINHKSGGVRIKSISVSTDSQQATTTALVLVVQGVADTRESLIQFRDNLEADPLVTKVELPISDLAKSKNVSYSLRIHTIRKI